MAASSLKPTRAVLLAVDRIFLASKNNPSADESVLSSKTDVSQARNTVTAWTVKVKSYFEDILESSDVVPSLRDSASLSKVVSDTLNGIVSDINIDMNHTKWVSKNNHVSVVASIKLRMQWLVDWISKTEQWLNADSDVYKVWVSRLAPNSCHVCIKMHGTAIPVEDSFSSELIKAGGRAYAGNFGASAHPRCRCKLIFVSADDGEELSGMNSAERKKWLSDNA